MSRERAGGFKTRDLGVDHSWNSLPLHRLPLDDPDYHLVWPVDLFASELDAVMARYDGQDHSVNLILEEAFVGSSAVDELMRAGSTRLVATELRRRASELREHEEARKPYYLERGRSVAASTDEPDWSGAARLFQRRVSSLDERGYFDRAWGPDCVDAHRDRRAPIDDISSELGVAGVNPFQENPSWDRDLLLSVAEVLHDRTARPRIVTRYHDFNDCGRHYGGYAVTPGQAVYRLEVNRVFRRARLPFRLSDTGEDYGRVVSHNDDATEDLVRQVVVTAGPQERDEVAHAIALFRARGADREAKRSAVLTLARILEHHRPLLKAQLMSADENALFQIANQFDIRHRNDKQLKEYDTEFLDWIFWTYLASVRLLHNLQGRGSDRP